MSLEAVGGTVNLLEEAVAWSTLAPRKSISPVFDRADDDHGAVLIALGNGHPSVCGCWRRTLPPVDDDGVYLIQVSFEAEGIERIDDSVFVILADGPGQGKPLFAEIERAERNDKQFHFRGLFEPVEGDSESEIELRLYLTNTANGSVCWTAATITRIPPPKPRMAKFAAITGEVAKSESADESMKFYYGRIEAVLEQESEIDLLVLPEHINIDGIRDNRFDHATTMPGAVTNRLGEYARKGNMYIGASLYEVDGKFLYNTCVLIDRAGKLVGTFRKVHLTNRERFFQGLNPGVEWPVFDTDFGRVGCMVCYDNHFPESLRALAARGAEIVIFPNAGDGREKEAIYEPYMRARAAENHVHIIAALNHGTSLIVNPRGEFDAVGDRSIGSFIAAECDLNRGIRDWTGRPAYRRYLNIRRPVAYDILCESQWDLLKG